jgi:hypothetical protein
MAHATTQGKPSLAPFMDISRIFRGVRFVTVTCEALVAVAPSSSWASAAAGR